jgi:monoamine oxidase
MYAYSRRKMLKSMALIPAYLLIPGWISGCKDEDEFAQLGYNGKVAVIGAGLSGLYATSLLLKQNVNVKLFEANSRVGGRVLTNESFAGFPVELGAEQIHGKHSILFDLLAQNGYPPSNIEENTNNFYLVNNQLRTEQYMNEQEQAATLTQTIDSIANYPGSEMLVSQYIENFVDQNLWVLANSLIGNEYGTSNNRLGMQGIQITEKIWTAGLEDYRVNQSLTAIFNQVFQKAQLIAQLQHEIKKVDYQGNKVVLTIQTPQGEIQESFDKVIITVSLNILKQWDSNNVFVPALPIAKTDSLARLGMDNGIKVVIKYSNRFWPIDLGSIFGGNLVPTYWVTQTNEPLLTAFVMGERAENLKSLGNNAITAIADELTLIYGTSANINNVVDFIIQDWSDEPYIKGAYSYPKLNALGAREELAKAVDNKIYFAGEATNINGHAATMHGALETGYRAAIEILKA